VSACAVHLQASALQELQKRFDQQEHQLSAATATAAAANGSEGVQVEPYFPEEKVQQELTMLQKVRGYLRPSDAHHFTISLAQFLALLACYPSCKQAGWLNVCSMGMCDGYKTPGRWGYQGFGDG